MNERGSQIRVMKHAQNFHSYCENQGISTLKSSSWHPKFHISKNNKFGVKWKMKVQFLKILLEISIFVSYR